MEELYRSIISEIGEDINREGLLKTPKRAKSAMKFFTSGYDVKIGDIINNAVFEVQNNNLIVIKDIEFYSLCEHHLLPFFGTCSVGYIPTGKVIGLSKIPRIVDVFARRLQLQEKLTFEIGEAIREAIDAKAVLVNLKAKHLCMMMRGVEKQNSLTVTEHITGSVTTDEIKHFYEMLHA